MNEEQRKLLDAPLPRERVSQREQAGRALSYVEGWWVISELNRIFGAGGWSYDAGDTREVDREKDERGRWCVSYSCRCVLRVGDTTIVDRGHGHGVDKRAGVAVESAEKEACTDALKRCAKSLGMRLGLALYDKTQEHVTDDPESEPVRYGAADEARVLEQWASMSELAKRAAWPSLSAEAKQKIKAAAAARKAG